MNLLKHKLTSTEPLIFLYNLNEISLDTKLLTYLNKKELNTYKKIKEDRRANYLKSKILLKNILSHYSKIPVNAIQYDYNKNGKPSLKNSTLQFNVSHSQHYLVIIISKDTPFGIDIECYRPIKNIKALTKKLFSSKEIEFIQNSAEPNKLFFIHWTNREAIVKSEGKALLSYSKQLTLIKSTDNQHTYKDLNTNILFYSYSLITNHYILSVASKQKQTTPFIHKVIKIS